MTSPDLDQMMQQEAIPMTSSSPECQLTADQSIAVCKQLQQVYLIVKFWFLLSSVMTLLAFSAPSANFLIIPLWAITDVYSTIV